MTKTHRHRQQFKPGDKRARSAHGLEIKRHDEQQRVHAKGHQACDSERSRENRAPQERERQ